METSVQIQTSHVQRTSYQPSSLHLIIRRLLHFNTGPVYSKQFRKIDQRKGEEPFVSPPYPNRPGSVAHDAHALIRHFRRTQERQPAICADRTATAYTFGRLRSLTEPHAACRVVCDATSSRLAHWVASMHIDRSTRMPCIRSAHSWSMLSEGPAAGDGLGLQIRGKIIARRWYWTGTRAGRVVGIERGPRLLKCFKELKVLVHVKLGRWGHCGVRLHRPSAGWVHWGHGEGRGDRLGAFLRGLFVRRAVQWGRWLRPLLAAELGQQVTQVHVKGPVILKLGVGRCQLGQDPGCKGGPCGGEGARGLDGRKLHVLGDLQHVGDGAAAHYWPPVVVLQGLNERGHDV
mmetsp:Transcript_99555/g.171380  ORF Transcript_99555/g.171380 Transcript_99555/m.171380 type:complete len:346 (-) Transcript_99555:456-1493(-)